MYIQPNSVIKLLTNCPLDDSYDHTLYFSNASAQASYFTGLTKYNFIAQTYQRHTNNTLRVQVLADNIFDCNYLMFQNTSYGNKWFYAFVKEVTYLNNSVSEIEYEIDVMQTWLFDYELEECFVEREHSITDNIGDNLVPEKLDTGDYISSSLQDTGVLGGVSLVVSATVKEEGGEIIDVGGAYYGGRFSGTYYTVFSDSMSGASECAEFLLKIVEAGKENSIVSVFTMPSALVTSLGFPANNYTVTYNKKYIDIDGYNPKNKKLFTSPYNTLYVTNYQGTGVEFPFEYFNTFSCKFIVTGDMSDGCTAVLAPINYKNDGDIPNYDEKMTLSCGNLCSYATDAYKSWLAQNGLSTAFNALSTGALGVAGASLLTNPVGQSIAVAGAVVGVASSIAQYRERTLLPYQAKGASGGATPEIIGIQDFGFMNKHIRAEFAKIIDSYFDMFGYATHKVKTPNIDSRPYWNYVKLGTVVLTGTLPASDSKKVESIYKNGVTFWKNGANVGNYSLDNSP